MDDAARVAAILARSPDGLASAYDAYGNALYAFCHSMLRDRHEAEDAVQDTFIVLAARVGQLRDPSRLRPWLYAVARTECLRRLRRARRVAPVEEVEDVMDESVDLAEGLRTRELQQLVWEAMEGLNAGERAALELSLRHGVDGDDLAAALGVTRANATKLMQRARGELDRSLGALLVARSADGTCAALGQIVDGWDGRLTPLMRKRLARHIDSCAGCGAQKRRRVNASALLAAIPLLAAPAALRKAVLEHDRTAMVSYDRAIVRRAWAFDRAGFPDDRGARRRARAAAIVGVLVIVVLAVVLPLRAQQPARHLGSLPSAPSSTAAPSTAPPSHTSSSKTRTRSSPGSSVVAPPPSSAHHPTTSSAPPSSSSTSSSQPPPKVTMTAAPTSLKFAAATGGTKSITLTASGDAVTWSAKDSAGLLKLSSYGSTIKAGASLKVYVTASSEKSGTTDTITFSWSTGSTTVTVYWS